MSFLVYICYIVQMKTVFHMTRMRLNGPEKAQHGLQRTEFKRKNQNAPRPSEHPPVRGKKCQNV